MRLRRVEAVRYGRLNDATLDDLGVGLTVVVGPNEAGKSTYTSLVRHVLYGYPTAVKKEPGYFVPGDGRLARLVFEDGDGSWVIERAEGPHGGAVRVRALSGPERPGLLAELTQGVSALAYRVVLGFGLDEMAAIEEQTAAGDDVISRLYAASAGLRVSPQEVRATLEQEAGQVFAPAGRKREINGLVAELRSARAELRTLRSEAAGFETAQRRLAELEELLPGVREALDGARARSTELAVAMQRADERVATIEAQEATLLELRQERKRLDEERAAIVVDEALLAAAPEIDALLDEAGGHIEALRAVADAEASVVRAEARAADVASRAGLDGAALSLLARDHEHIDAVESAREDLQRLELLVGTRTESLERSEAVLAQAQAAAERALEPLGIVADDPADAIAERSSALDAIESLRASAPREARTTVDISAVIMLVSGVAAIATGVFLREWITVGIGVVLVAAGLVFLVRSRAGVPVVLTADEHTYLRVLGLEADAGTLELSRMRRSLEFARTAVGSMTAAAQAREEAAREAKLAGDALATRRALWAEWLAARGLDGALTPGAAATVLGLAREARIADESAAEMREDLSRRLGQIDAFVVRFIEAAGRFVELPARPGRADLPALVNRLKDRLAAARAAAARVEEIAGQIRPAESRIAAEDARAEKAASELRETLGRYGLTDGGTHDDLRVLHARSAQDEREASDEFEAVVGEINQLEAKLEKEAREQRGVVLQLEEAGIQERIADAVDRYLVRACAARLLADAQRRYERERQPEVVREAGRLFATMTDGRYATLAVPLGEGRIEVFDARSGAHTSDVLSRGTAEQLYLAIRLGLIARMGESGSGLPVLMDDVLVNFDPERRLGAARAIAEVAATRQIVFFTCHPETAAAFADAAGEHTRIDLARIAV